MVFERPRKRVSQPSKLSSPRNVFQRQYLSKEEEQAFYNRPIYKGQYEATSLLPDAPYTPPVQTKTEDSGNNQEIIQEKSEDTPNKTGLPDRLKTGVENLSGYSLDDVRVHYNSPKPAQLQAHAYTQGTDIHVAPGQEQHLPHETWHVVQQMQGRVKPTMQMQGVQINDDEGLEREADVMGKKSTKKNQRTREGRKNIPEKIVQEKVNTNPALIQCYQSKDLKIADDYIKTKNSYEIEVFKKVDEYAQRIDKLVTSEVVGERDIGKKMAEGLKIWSENYYNKSQAYLYEGQKAKDFTNGNEYRYAILGVDTDKNPDLEVQSWHQDTGWKSTAIEFKACTSSDEKATQKLLTEGLKQLAKREKNGDAWGMPYKQLLLTIHNDNPENCFPFTATNRPSSPEKLTEDDWNGALLERANKIKSEEFKGIKTYLEVRLEHNGQRYATVHWPAVEE